ncbi:MAG: enoyl-CoA hydratase/isomerase family protein [Alphaproteobacteria bacterium]|nr:enoyl-CoA hydratase/isomerase family protein [Alphaproteobacteria bacterium]
MESLDEIVRHNWVRLKLSHDNGILVVRLARPEARNALDPVMMAELTLCAQRISRSAMLRAVILCGNDDFFSAGVDLKASRQRALSDLALLEQRTQAAAGPDLCKAWEEIEAITIAAVEGFCIGGACALALACDFRILAERAYLRLPEVPLGMNMSWHALPRLHALIGASRAKQFVLFGEPLTAEQCLSWGLADQICPKGDALQMARQWAARVRALPPVPVRMTKEAINGLSKSASSGFMDRDQFLLCARSNDYSEGTRAFLEKRTPQFRGE